MDGTPHLLTDVKFSERRRGYDPEEVDNFLERVSGAVAQLQDKLREATARAEEADARIAEAKRGEAAAMAELARAGEVAERPEPLDDEAEAARASKILLMAQKTADATIEDANNTAQQAIAEARAKASELRAEAESEAAKARADAKREAAELVEEQRAIVVRDVKDLEELRASVKADVELLQRHVEEQRNRLRLGLEALQGVIDDPAALRLDGPPEIGNASITDVLADVDEDETVIDIEATEADVSHEPAPAPEPASSDASAAAASDDPVVLLNNGVDIGGVDLTSPPAAPVASGVFGGAGEPQPRREPDIDLASEELFAAADRKDDAGPPTQSFSPFAEAEDPLGPPDDDADKAMRAFFEADFESEEDRSKSRFGFRR
jgi:DivIVA domain-containing protein